MKYYILEWNGLDNNIDLYDFVSAKEDIAEVYEELELHNCSYALVMDLPKLNSLLKAVEVFRAKMEAEIEQT